MGRNNQQRRAAKKRKKQQLQRRRGPSGGGKGAGAPPHDDVPPMDELVRAAALAWGADDARHEALVEILAAHGDAATGAHQRSRVGHRVRLRG